MQVRRLVVRSLWFLGILGIVIYGMYQLTGTMHGPPELISKKYDALGTIAGISPFLGLGFIWYPSFVRMLAEKERKKLSEREL